MKTIEDIRKINNELLISTNDEKYKMIAEILEDDNAFFKLNSEIAFDILFNLGIDNIKEVYEELINVNNYIDNKVLIHS